MKITKHARLRSSDRFLSKDTQITIEYLFEQAIKHGRFIGENRIIHRNRVFVTDLLTGTLITCYKVKSDD